MNKMNIVLILLPWNFIIRLETKLVQNIYELWNLPIACDIWIINNVNILGSKEVYIWKQLDLRRNRLSKNLH